MRRMSMLAVMCAIVGIWGIWVVAAATNADRTWDVSGVENIRIDGVSGDVVILPAKSGKERVELYYDVHPDDCFEADVEEKGGTLRIKERWHGSSSGHVKWTLYLPTKGKAPSVRISTASGDLECEDVEVAIEFNTASGDIELSGVDLKEDSEFSTASGDYTIENMTIRDDIEFSTASGDMELVDLTIGEGCSFSSASGDIEVSGCRCADDVRFSSASGDVKVKNTSLKGEGRFSSASGDVAVYLDEMPKDDLTASSASGDVTLDVKQYGDDFTLILIKRKDRGRISCPFDYTEEDEFRDHHVYERKIVKRGSGEPTIELRTASGKVVVRK
jgi:DUF4097 and DUF4098 domain-containing protein YvlB